MFKRLNKYAIAAYVLVILLVLGGCCPKVSESLPVTLHPQETSMWCWAASAQMVMDYLGHDVAQCVQANNRFGRNDCCNTPVDTACVHGGWPEFNKYGFSFKTTSWAPLTWEQLRKEISRGNNCGGTPFCFTWKWNGTGGHMMVAIGYLTVGGIHYVEMLNPSPVGTGSHKFITYNAYVSGSYYTHWNDYYEIRYTGGV